MEPKEAETKTEKKELAISAETTRKYHAIIALCANTYGRMIELPLEPITMAVLSPVAK